MLTVQWGERLPAPCALVLGGFDGLHLGHRRLLAEAKALGLPVALTTMYGGKGKALFSREERKVLFAQAGVDFLLEIPLGGSMRALPAETFCAQLFEAVPARLVVCGEDFRFGRGAAGTPALLKTLAPCPVSVMSIVKGDLGGGRMRKIAASACKELLKRGELARLNACLAPDGDGAYFIRAIVEHGREVGRTYGFPTLNLTPPPEKLLPPDGVYGGRTRTPQGVFPCIIHLGARPTFGVEEKKIEVYLDGFSGDLYGETVCVYPSERYRGVEKFPSKEALRAQLERDILRLRSNG